MMKRLQQLKKVQMHILTAAVMKMTGAWAAESGRGGLVRKGEGKLKESAMSVTSSEFCWWMVCLCV